MYDVKRIKGQLSEWMKLVFSFKGFWVFIPGIIAVAAVYFIDKSMSGDARSVLISLVGKDIMYRDLISKPWNEVAAVVLMAITSFIFLVRVIVYSFDVDKILLALSSAFLCREIHFVGTHSGVYVAVSLILIWCVVWNKRLLAEFASSTALRLVTFGTAFTYALAIFIQRRALKSIVPDSMRALEKKLHISLEEVTENTAHLFFCRNRNRLLFCSPKFK